jgi:glycosyltransferase involved in cell wall biosynthesis
VTPSLNQGRFLGEAIRSVLEPCYPQLDYIVADAGSTDDTAKVLDPFGAKLLLVKTADDGGPAAALNQGFARARGEIMGTLCADDLLLPGALHCIADYFSRHPQVDVVYGHRVLIDAAGAEVGRWVLPGHNDAVLSAACFVPPETLFWRRSLWDKVGGRFDERLQMAHVWELLLRFRQAGARMVRLPRFLGAYRLHPDQRSAGELALTALVEQQRLRAAGRHRHLIGYLARHLLLDRLYRRGILRY